MNDTQKIEEIKQVILTWAQSDEITIEEAYQTLVVITLIVTEP